jgi:hypothetical protein
MFSFTSILLLIFSLIDFDLANYRGISLLPVLGKIYSGLLACRLRVWLMNYNKLTMFQVGFTKGKRTVDNIFIIKTCVDKYLKVKRGKLYWCFVDFEKAFDCINREALWYKMRKTGVSGSMVSNIKKVYQNITICVKCGENHRSSCASQTKGLRQGCGLSPYLFNIFINHIIDYIDKEKTHSSVIRELKIPVLLFADDLAVASFTCYGLQKKIERVDQYCKDWNLRCNLSKCKIMVFKKGGKWKAAERWNVNGQNIEVAGKFNYLGVTLDSTGSWNKQKTSAKMKRYQAFRAID